MSEKHQTNGALLVGRILEAEERSANWLAKGNEYAEKGAKAKADYCYERSASWLMRANKLRKW
jgi:hypothetical protein